MISLIQPSRNNLRYLKWSYDSVRKNAGDDIEICVADDFSSDGTWEWCQEVMKYDPNFKAIRNEGPTRLGHTILYDKLINEVATREIVGIWHADMYMTPGTIEGIIESFKPSIDAKENEHNWVVSLTRIEPPLHPVGPEKVVKDFGTEPEEFKEKEFLDWYSLYKLGVIDKATEGVFAPWFIRKVDFQAIGGHDPLYAPQSKEDSDIFNRFALKGYKFIQLWEHAIYHMTCRGSRFNPSITKVGTNSREWDYQNIISSRNFIRKWGTFVKHDEFMKPIIPKKFDITFIMREANTKLFTLLEPWCSTIYSDLEYPEIIKYKEKEQRNTKFDLTKKIHSTGSIYTMTKIPKKGIVVEFNANAFTQSSFNVLAQFAEIFGEEGIEIGEFEVDVFRIHIYDTKHYENLLIYLDNPYYQAQLLRG